MSWLDNKICLAICLTGLTFFAACEKEQPEPDPCENTWTLFLDGEMASLKFAPDSYWNYFDALTQESDSQYVDSAHAGFMNIGSCENNLAEFHYMRIHSTLDSTSTGYYVLPDGMHPNNYSLGVGAVVYRGTGDLARHLGVEMYDRILLGDRVYEDVTLIQITNPNSEKARRVAYYANSTVGVIRIASYDSHGELSSDKILTSWRILY